ncbi:MAG: broad specificity phosphatase PhoE [Planctomycetota bacterium]|jgi:broad specificity phosphatase PhoE
MVESNQLEPPTPTKGSVRIHLVRHGLVEAQWHGKVYGQLDVELSMEGEEQARRAAQALASVELAGVISSGLERAEFGAACIRSDRNLKRRDEPALAEIDRGKWAGLLPQEIEEHWPGGWRNWWLNPKQTQPPGGESLSDLSQRVLPCIEALAAEYGGREIAVVAHSWVIRICVTHALGLGCEATTRFDLPPASIAVLDWPQKTPNSLKRPVLASFCSDSAPNNEAGWFRGPRREAD